MTMEARPVKRRHAAALVAELHRHHPKAPRGWLFGTSAWVGEKMVGVAFVGRPSARLFDDGRTCEVTRLCTDGTKNACSFLLSRCARAAAALGYGRIITYVLESERGDSLRASGWTCDGPTRGGEWDRQKRPRRASAPTCPKARWSKAL